MEAFTPAYMRTGPKYEAENTAFNEMQKESEKKVRSQVPQTRGRTKRPKGTREQKGASAKKVPENYFADLNEFSEELYKKLLRAYKKLDNHEMVLLPMTPSYQLHEFIEMQTQEYYNQVMNYLNTTQVPGKVAKALKRKAKGFQKKSEKRKVKYATDTQTRNWSASPPKAFSDFKQIYVDFYKHLINSHLKATPEDQKAERERAHDEKGNKLTEFFNTYPELKKRRLPRA
jgi:hypothetical protein